VPSSAATAFVVIAAGEEVIAPRRGVQYRKAGSSSTIYEEGKVPVCRTAIARRLLACIPVTHRGLVVELAVITGHH